MKLRHRLSLLAIFLFSLIFLGVTCLIYFSFYKIVQGKELRALESKTLLAAIYYLEKDELSTSDHDEIKDKLQQSILKSNIAIYNASDNQVNGALQMKADPKFLSDTRLYEKNNLITADYFYNALFYKDNEGDFVVITRESKAEFNAQMSTLLTILLTVSLIALFFIFCSSQILGYWAYRPINSIIKQIGDRKLRDFYQPITLKKTYAEVEDLISTYNSFIDQIAKTFEVQKNFINYVSHELRTPITALLGTIDVASQKNRTTSEYQEILTSLNQYTIDLQDALDQMRLLSGEKTNFELRQTRIDEVIWQVVENAILYHHAQINVNIDVENDSLLKINGNDKLLELAIGNIVSNAIKYSNNSLVKISFVEKEQHLEISIADTGIGIDAEDIVRIRDNFYRADNAKEFQGKGIGLSISNIIFTFHKITLKITSKLGEGTVVTLIFP